MLLSKPALRGMVLLLLAFVSTNAAAQVDFRRFEPDWCKPHPRFNAVFASSNYETAHVPVTYNRSVEATGWRISGDQGAARVLGLKPTTLHAKMKKLGIRRPGPRAPR